MFLSWQTYEGLQISAYSVVEATKFLLNEGMEYVLTERFCQDPLEEYVEGKTETDHGSMFQMTQCQRGKNNDYLIYARYFLGCKNFRLRV